MDLQKFFQEGLASDLIMAERHYFVYRTIGEHAHLINLAAKSTERSALNYMQEAAMNMTLISLSKIYDSKSRNKNYLVRSLDSLIDMGGQIDAHFPYSLEYFEAFEKLEKLVQIPFASKVISTKDELFNYFKTILKSQIVKIKVDHLKIVRDKYIVHNEHLDEVPHIPDFWEEVAFLLDLGKLISSIVGNIFLHTEYININEVGPNRIHYSVLFDFHWLIEMIGKVVGKEDFVQWWED
ncbi:AbiU2 domain-containing protein [Algoriphagus aquimarinus]|uniref:HEPN AbiU2-like domain-containing protein n=1 Tax=Algoriphagus aquimarinus TaxID=237018 RepID=A0A1I1AUC9_9BACT|nr:hypothetical protein [Algoriphagus aquimarinus]SFB40048.1 hypothetical protein SAMN04489723_10929 [Algoriphagus aquimarinus]